MATTMTRDAGAIRSRRLGLLTGLQVVDLRETERPSEE